MKPGKVLKRFLALGLCTALFFGDLQIVKASEISTTDAEIAIESLEEISSEEPAKDGLENTTEEVGQETGEETKEDSTGEPPQETAGEDKVEDEQEPVEEKIRFDYHSDLVNVMVTLKDESDLPENAELVVSPMEVTAQMEETIGASMVEKRRSIASINAFDIKFVVDGQEVEPGDTVKVQISISEVTVGDSASVYHYDEKVDQVEDMEASVSDDGLVEFDTTHFSTYVIVNTGGEKVTVRIEHIDNDTGKKIYADDVKELTVGAEIINYKKASNWDIVEVTKENGSVINNIAEISVTSDMTIQVYYTPSKDTITRPVTFYDYVVKSVDKDGKDNPKGSINTKDNYPKNSENKNRLSVGTIDQNYASNQYNTMIGGKNVNTYTSGKEGVVPGIVTGLSEDYKDVKFSVDEPGLFSNYDKDSTGVNKVVGKTILNDYTLEFKRAGDTYELSRVLNSLQSEVAEAGNGFFPLDNAVSNVTDRSNGNGHNHYFGMRYDITFELGDYIGPLNYKFTGDDDLWVILDGEKVVIDLGGIHDSLTGEVDLWKVLGMEEGVGATTEEEKSKEHRLTILYMERGANEANCQMNFTLPSAEIISVTNTTTSLTFKKTNSGLDPLKDAEFKLTGEEVEYIETAVSQEDGTVIFNGLEVGTYILIETAAPSGYTTENISWIVKVDDNLDAKLYLADGKTEVKDNRIINRTNQEISDSTIEYDKTAQLTDWDERKYELTISASSTGTTTTTTPKNVDVMMVFDLSGSMNGSMNGGYSPQTQKFRILARDWIIPIYRDQYTDIRDDLDTKKIYYYDKGDRATPDVSGSNYKYAQNPMKYINDTWMYYSYKDNTWINIKNDSSKSVYTWDSRLSALKEAASSFVTSMAEKTPDSKVGLASFYGEGTQKSNRTVGSLNYGLAEITANPTNLLKSINSLKADGGTSPQKGLEEARKVLDGANDKNAKYMILFTDGEPSTDNDKKETQAKAQELKGKGYTIITVGLGLNNITETWLKTEIATSPDWALIAKDAEELNKIFDNLQETITEDSTIVNAKVTDVIDSRFQLADGECVRLTDKYGDKVTITENYDGTTRVTWTGQKIPPKSKGGWTEVLNIVAKDTFIGGNNITTNVSPDSYISIPGDKDNVTLPQPTVNVKVEFFVKDVDNIIFLGEGIYTDADILDNLFDSGAFTGLNEEILTDADFTFEWYEDKGLTKQITLEKMAEVIPTSTIDEKEYYLKVTYNAGEPTDKSNKNSTLDGSNQPCVAGGDNQLVEAVNVNDPKLNYGIYTTKIKDGSIIITKKINKSSYVKNEGDPIFTFKITNLKDDTIYYRTVRFDVDVDEGNLYTMVREFLFGNDYYHVSAELKNLPLGMYKIEELSTMGFKFDSLEIINETTTCETSIKDNYVLCAVGYDMNSNGGNFFDMDDYTTLISNSKDDHLDKTKAEVVVTNVKAREPGKETDTDVVKNSLVIGEPFEGNYDADNMERKN